MPLFRRRPRDIDYDKLADKIAAKAIQPAIAQAATVRAGTNTLSSSPFSQTGGGAMENPLPRPPGAFDSLFGPGVPLIPDPLDPVGRNGRTPPRRSDYLVSWNMQLVDRQVPWTMLRWLAEDCDVVNRAIQLTQDEQCGLDWGWSFSDQILAQIMDATGETNSAKATQIARERYGSDLLRVQQFFESPDPDMNQSFTDWLQALLWDHLVYDGVAVYPRQNLDGTLRNLELIDASTIKLLRDNRGRVPQPPAPAYQQILYGFPRGEFQHNPDEGDDEFALDQLAYFIRRPRNTSVYGYPQVEEVMALATTYLGRQAWMRAEYTTGVTPKMILELAETDSWTPEQMAYYEQAFNDRLTGQIERRQMAFLMRPGAKATWAPQIDEHYKSDYDNWLIGQIASRFGRPPSMLGVQAKAGLSGGKQMEGEMNQSDIYSGAALTKWLIGVLNTLARRYLGVGPEITATVGGGGSSTDIAAAALADASDVGAGIVTRNEVRAKRHQPLMDEPEADQLAITTGQGVIFLAGQLKAQEAAQAAATAEPAKPAAPAPGNSPDPGAVPAPPDAATQTAGQDPAAKAEDGTPKGLAARNAATARIAEYYTPKIAAALKAAHPKIGPAARKVAVLNQQTKKAADPTRVASIAQVVLEFRQAHPADITALTTVLAAMYADGWVAGITAAKTGKAGAAIAAAAGPVDPDPVDWTPGWGETVNTRLPAELQSLQQQAAQTAARIADGQMNRVCDTLTNSLTDNGPLADLTSTIADIVGDPGKAADVATNETNVAANTASTVAYATAGISTWDWVTDGGACSLCQARAAAGPYPVGDDDLPPAHGRCGCGTDPHTDEPEQEG